MQPSSNDVLGCSIGLNVLSLQLSNHIHTFSLMFESKNGLSKHFKLDFLLFEFGKRFDSFIGESGIF